MDTFEITYDDVYITPYDTSGFSYEIVGDTVSRNSFGIGIEVYFEANVTSIPVINGMCSFGFSTALACSCIDPEYIFMDPIDTAEIFMLDTVTEQKINVTSNFGIQYSDSLTSVKDFFEQRVEDYYYDSYFQFELVTFHDIPNTVIFSVELQLESGIILTNETVAVNFI